MTGNMTYEQAKQAARQWVNQRKSVRTALIAKARELYPPDERFGMPESRIERTVFKLWNYPSDLSEKRLLKLIEYGA